MYRRSLLSIALTLVATGFCVAGEFNAGVTVSNKTVFGNVTYKEKMMSGYWRLGGAGVYADKSDKAYKWLELDYALGNDLLYPGLILEAGFKGVVGDAEMGVFAGDIGALGFTAKIGYLLPTTITFIPVEVSGDIGYAPPILSFRDNDNYFAYGLSVGVQIVENAAIIAGYYGYDVKMEEGPGNWTLSDSQFRFGLELGF